MKTVLALLVGAVTLSSCIGSFGLTNKLLDWNKGLSNKFVNELVFILISPAYAVCGLADLLVLNTVEFWTDSKVIAHVGETKEVMGQDGRMYAVKTLKNGYEITDPNGEKSYLVYNKKEKSWNYKDNGALKELFRFNDDGTISYEEDTVLVIPGVPKEFHHTDKNTLKMIAAPRPNPMMVEEGLCNRNPK